MKGDPNLLGALAYSIGLVSGLVMLVVVKDDPYVRFHARQSVFTFGAIFLLMLLLPTFPVFDAMVRLGLRLAVVALWVFLMIKALRGETYHLPIIGDLAAK